MFEGDRFQRLEKTIATTQVSKGKWGWGKGKSTVLNRKYIEVFHEHVKVTSSDEILLFSWYKILKKLVNDTFCSVVFLITELMCALLKNLFYSGSINKRKKKKSITFGNNRKRKHMQKCSKTKLAFSDFTESQNVGRNLGRSPSPIPLPQQECLD